MTTETDQSDFMTWAESEVRRAGLFDAAGHSGFSAAIATNIFGRLARWRTLTPLTNHPGEWMIVDRDRQRPDEPSMWQSRRQPSCFSTDAGRSYYDINERQARWRRAAERIARSLRLYRPWMFTKHHQTDEGGGS